MCIQVIKGKSVNDFLSFNKLSIFLILPEFSSSVLVLSSLRPRSHGLLGSSFKHLDVIYGIEFKD